MHDDIYVAGPVMPINLMGPPILLISFISVPSSSVRLPRQHLHCSEEQLQNTAYAFRSCNLARILHLLTRLCMQRQTRGTAASIRPSTTMEINLDATCHQGATRVAKPLHRRCSERTCRRPPTASVCWWWCLQDASEQAARRIHTMT
jgi:hypothetical protein